MERDNINRCGWTVNSSRGRDGGVVAWNGSQSVTLPLMAGSSKARAFDINDAGIVAGTSFFQGKGKTPGTLRGDGRWRGLRALRAHHDTLM